VIYSSARITTDLLLSDLGLGPAPARPTAHAASRPRDTQPAGAL